jgi:hypothetical protein
MRPADLWAGHISDRGTPCPALPQVASLKAQLAAKCSDADSLRRKVAAGSTLATALEQVRVVAAAVCAGTPACRAWC